MILDGLWLTLAITFFAIILATILGAAICGARMSSKKWLNTLSVVYIDLMRGVPILVLLMIMYYIVLAPFDANGFIVSIITFGLCHSAYMSEMFRTSIERIDKGQLEAGMALGLPKKQAFTSIILPQAIKSIIPVYQGEVVSMLKGTAVVGYIAVVDVTKACDLIRSRTFDAFFPLLTAAVLYFFFAWLIGFVLSRVGKKKRNIGGIAILALCLLLPLHSCASAAGEKFTTEEEVIQRGTIAIAAGSSYEMEYLKFMDRNRVKIYPSSADCLNALKTKKVDSCLGDLLSASTLIEQDSSLVAIPTHLEPVHMGAAFNKDNVELTAHFISFIDQIKENGILEELTQRWISDVPLSDRHVDIPLPEKGEPLRLVIPGGTAPLEFVTERGYDGLEIEVVQRFASELGRPLKIETGDRTTFIASLCTGKADLAVSSIGDTPERRKVVAIIPFLDNDVIMLVKKNVAEPHNSANRSLIGIVFLLTIGILCAFFAFKTFIKKKSSGRRSSTMESSDDSIICISHLSKTFPDGTSVLKDVNLKVKNGEVISIIGPSGTGKSTLLRCLNLLETPTGGEIHIGGQDILAEDADVPKIREKMGMVFQNFNLFSDMTALQNVIFVPLKLKKMEPEAARKRGMELLDMVGLASKCDLMPSQLSGGQKQRVAIARALAMEPEILLFDEPTSALDPTMVSEVLGVIQMLSKLGKTMMIVTHEMKFARDVSTRVLYMDQGIIYEEGTPGQIFDNPQKHNTKVFINRIRNIDFSIDGQFDYFTMYAQIDAFCMRYSFPLPKKDAVTHIIEEFLELVNERRDIQLSLNYSEKDGSVSISFVLPDSIPLPDTESDDISASMLRLYAGKISVEKTESGQNKIIFVVF